MATHIPTGETIRFELRDRRVMLGRATPEDTEGKLSVPFDPKLSRRLAFLEVGGGVVTVERDQSRYPLFHEGREKSRFELLPGERFSSGETVFELLEEAHTLTVAVMERVNRGNAEKALQVLLGFQPLLQRFQQPRELAVEAVGLLGQLLPGARVGFFQLDDGDEPNALVSTPIRPSRSLIARALLERLPAYHLWQAGGGLQPTQQEGESWALAAPILSSDERLLLYAVGRHSASAPGEVERSVLGLVAQLLAQHLEGRRSVLLAGRVEAEAEANRRLRVLLGTIESSMSLREEGFQRILLDGARSLTGARSAFFELDLGETVSKGSRFRTGLDSEGAYLAAVFDGSYPQGILCRAEEPFTPEQAEWLLALLGFAETVFENRRLHNRVRSSLEQLRESQTRLVRSSQWAAAGRLAANAAHELNTPLGAIKLAAETALAFLSDGPKPSRDSLQLIQRSVERCRQVTERLLVYSRPRETKSRERFSLTEVVEDSVNSLARLLESKEIDLQLEEPSEAFVLGDPHDCYWAVTNVLKNAAEALSEVEGPRRVRLSTFSRGGFLLLLVEDSGPGVPPGLEEEIFEPFFSTRKIGEGNGLGLAVSRRDLRAWGGDIEVVASGLGGAGFRLRLPEAGPEEGEDRQRVQRDL